MTYVMSDLHGCYEEFIKMLQLIGFTDKDTMYILGDVVDRGPHPIKLLKYIMERKNIILIKGNHEEMMENALITESKRSQLLWIQNGCTTTLFEYDDLSEEEKNQILNYIIHLDYLKKINVNNTEYLLVHGGLYKGFEKDVENGSIVGPELVWERPSQKMFNRRRGYEKCKGLFDKVICGHTPTVNYGKKSAGKILKWDNIILIDAGGVFGFKFACLCLDTDEEFYIKGYDN